MDLCSKEMKDQIKSFYRDVASNTEGMATYGRWIYGVYPTDEIVDDYVDKNQMYYLSNNEDIIAAVAVTDQGEAYHGLNWSKEFQDSEVLVFHVLAVSPNYQHQGIARILLSEVIDKARREGKKAIRFDALSCNTHAHRLYESVKFKKVDTRNWYADNTGWIDFYLYEMNL